MLNRKLSARTYPTLVALIALILGLTNSDRAAAVTLYAEDFESLTLGPYVNECCGDGTDWTATPPTGIGVDTTTTPVGNLAEFFGWTFHDKASWVSTAGDQSRSAFTRGSGTVALADADEYDDNPLGIIRPNLMNVFMSIPLSVAGTSNLLQISFDSSFRPSGTMEGLLDVSFDGGTSFVNLLSLVAGPGFPSESLTRVNERITLQTPRTGDDLVVRFGLVNGGNDWWWAVDNISIDSVPEPNSLGLVALGLLAVLAKRRRAAGTV